MDNARVFRCRGMYAAKGSESVTQPQAAGRAARTDADRGVVNAFINPSLIASAPPTISASVSSIRSRAVPASGSGAQKIPRQISGRTDWAAKYLHTTTKYTK